MNTILLCENNSDLRVPLNLQKKLKFSGVITKFSSDDYKREYLNEEIGKNHQRFTRCPLSFLSVDFDTIVPMLEITNLLSCDNDEVRLNYEERIITDIKYCLHLKPFGPIYIRSSCSDPEKLGKFLLSALPKKSSYIPNFIVEVDFVNKRYYQRDNEINNEDEDEIEDSWSFWNRIHKAADYSNRIEVALVFSSDLPFNNKEIVTRWLGESIHLLVFPTDAFKSNSNNYPILSNAYIPIVKLFFKCLQCAIVIDSKNMDENIIKHCTDYLQFLFRMTPTNEHKIEQDVPRYPLQPLRDDLDFSTYETFERDKAKYVLYQKAIEAALIDLISESEKNEKFGIVMIVGAGRGALVRAALNARTNTGRKIKIIVVEKNRNAINVLTALANEMWMDENIEIIAKDMRKIQLEEKADIIVSELLGSFGDNELSPECLDGVQHLLKENTGISIPCNSISYLRPIMSKRIVSNIKEMVVQNVKEDETRFHHSFLLYMQNAFYITKAQECFKFVHPNREIPIENTRNKTLKFTPSIDCILHGFAGYFTSQLYKDIEISIHPESHTKGMVSWYTMVFPLPQPIEVKENECIELNFSRKLDEKKVWYEYQVISPQKSIVINKSGEVDAILK